MLKILIYTIKIIITATLALLVSSCGYRKIEGTGNVVTKTRPLTGFNSISAEGGLDIVIEQSSQTSVTVEADENLHQHIKTELKGNTLFISTDADIDNAEAKKVIVQLPLIKGIASEGGVSVEGKNIIKADNIDLDGGGGSMIEISVDAVSVNCESGSGSNIKIHGKTGRLNVDASGGSVISAKGLAAKSVKAEASSGARIYVNASKELVAEASSGSKVLYASTPEKLSKKVSSGGDVAQD
ncbi:head GIN domain-containing protein [Flavobacterium cyanobacteriorum]|nr:head GIN domain-containing protein [Flavobacterium cyanobacteriorum]